MTFKIEQLTDQLRQLCLQPNMELMIHVSMRAIGGLEISPQYSTGADQLIATLQSAVSPNGTLLAYLDFEPINEPTNTTAYFDLNRSPAAIDHGVFAECFRRFNKGPNSEKVYRSDNPGASVAALGKQAEWYCQNHSMDFGYGEDSPFGKLVQREGYILIIGAHLDHVSILHHAEQIANLPKKKIIEVEYQIFDGQNIQSKTVIEYETSEPVVEGMPDNYFEQIMKDYLTQGTFTAGKIGNADSYLIPAKELVEFAVKKMEREFG